MDVVFFYSKVFVDYSGFWRKDSFFRELQSFSTSLTTCLTKVRLLFFVSALVVLIDLNVTS